MNGCITYSAVMEESGRREVNSGRVSDKPQSSGSYRAPSFLGIVNT